MSEVTLMLQAIGRGEKQASEDLLPLVYEELRRLATARMAQEAAGQTLQPTALVHEAWLRLVGDGDHGWENRAHFFGAAAEAMRRILIDSARKRSMLKRGGDRVRVELGELDLVTATPDDRVLLIDEALERLKVSDPELAQLVVLKFFGGMTNEEIAHMKGANERTIRRQWNYARAWLLENIREEL
ncbi:MAG: sigma-70 family RNA polymerase sigma factor [Verrucomicrobia bacterium]|nr:MAG: sigma-70 family RNA polymerase sigma factor [Verrucomicrobiota bacterium]